VVTELAKAGVDAFRLNFSHGTHEQHANAAQTVRAVQSDLTRVIADLHRSCASARSGARARWATRLSLSANARDGEPPLRARRDWRVLMLDTMRRSTTGSCGSRSRKSATGARCRVVGRWWDARQSPRRPGAVRR
jgi:hypothetical protein